MTYVERRNKVRETIKTHLPASDHGYMVRYGLDESRLIRKIEVIGQINALENNPNLINQIKADLAEAGITTVYNVEYIDLPDIAGGDWSCSAVTVYIPSKE